MLSKIINYFDHFNPEILLTLIGLLLITLGLFIWFWFRSKKRYEALSYQVPPEVLKNYMASMSQNSSASHSNLNAPAHNPTVVSARDLQGGGNISVGSSDGSSNNELLGLKNAEITNLREELNSKTNHALELEQKADDLDVELDQKNNYIKELEAKLAGSSEEESSPEQKAEMDNLVKERDELKEKLDEYAIIEDDLADLKRIKQENEELKAALGDEGSAPTPAAPAEDEASEEEILAESSDEPDSLESLAEALENNEEAAKEGQAEEALAAADEASAEPEESALEAAAAIMDEIVSDGDSPEAEKVAKAENSEAEKQEAEASESQAQEPEAPESQPQEAETQVAAAQEEPTKEEASSNSEEAQPETVVAQDSQGGEEGAEQGSVEEEKTLDDLLSEFEKMLG